MGSLAACSSSVSVTTAEPTTQPPPSDQPPPPNQPKPSAKVGKVDEDALASGALPEFAAAGLFEELSSPTYRLLNGLASGVTARIDAATGAVVFGGRADLAPSASGTVPLLFTVVATEDDGTSATRTITIDVNARDDAPVRTASTLSFSVVEKAPITGKSGSLTALFSDPEGQDLTFALVGPTSAMGVTATIGTDGSVSLSGTPDDVQTATSVTFSVTASDGTNSTSPYLITVTIGVDDAGPDAPKKPTTKPVTDPVKDPADPGPTRTASTLSAFAVEEQQDIADKDAADRVKDLAPLFEDDGSVVGFGFIGAEAVAGNAQQASKFGVTATIGTDNKVSLSGTPDNVLTDTVISFTVTATDDGGQSSSEHYVMTISVSADDDAPERSAEFFVVRNLVGAGFAAIELDPEEHFTDDGGATNLRLSVTGFDTLSTEEKHGISSVSIVGGTTLSIGGMFAEGTALGSKLSLKLVATDANSGTVTKTLSIEAATPPATMTISDGADDLRPLGDVDGDGFDDLAWAGKGTLLKGGELAASVFSASEAIFLPGITSALSSQLFAVGDVNADGKVDLIYRDSATKSVLSLSPDAARVTIELTSLTSVNFSILADFVDLNGDGTVDLLLGAHKGDEIFFGRYASVVFGSAQLGTDTSLDVSILGTAGVRIDSAHGGMGEAVASAGDVNGDGVDDAIIGGGFFGRGTAYVLYGGDEFASSFAGNLGSDNEVLLGLGGRVFYLYGEGVDSRLGGSVSGGGDFNGDGFDDVVIGAPGTYDNSSSDFRSTPVPDHGAAYVVFGSATPNRGGLEAARPETEEDGVVTIGDTLGDDGFAIFGAVADERLGYSVSMVGDVNGDGFDDVAIGSPYGDHGGNTNAGAIYIVFGRASGFDDIYIGELDSAAKLQAKGIEAITGTSANQELGRHVASAGDVDGDGLEDLLVGAADGEDAFVVFGRALAASAAAPSPAGVVKATASQADIVGTSTTGEFLQGSAGDNAIGMIGSGDVAYGGAGDDRFTITAIDFKRAYGGYGTDTLNLAASGLTLSLSDHGRSAARLESIERIDITGTGNNTLELDAHAVFQLSEQRSGGKTVLRIDGNAGDRVIFHDNTVWVKGTDEGAYSVWTNGAVARVLIDSDIAVSDPFPKLKPSADPLSFRQKPGTVFAPIGIDAAEHFIDDGGVANLTLSVTGFDDLSTENKHGITSVSMGSGNTLSIGGDFDDDATLGTRLALTLVATDGDDWSVAKPLSIEALAPLATMTISDAFGVNPIGDVDGDGFDDLAVGIGGGEHALVAGGASLPYLFAPSPASLIPGVADAYAYVLGSGDVNADGRADLMLEFYSAEGVASLSLLLSPNAVRVAIDSFGSAEAADFADVNGDGIDDVLMGREKITGFGTTHKSSASVVFGGAHLDASTSIGVGIDGIEDSYFGQEIAGVGDVNGDGIDDMIIGASGENSRVGAAYVLYGGDGLATGFAGDAASDGTVLGALGTRGFAVSGDTGADAIFQGSWLGGSVSGGGDFNGDGFDDVVIGSHGIDFNSSSSAATSVQFHGGAYVVFGGATADRGTLDSTRDDTMLGSTHATDGDSEALGTDGFAIFGAVAHAWLGIKVSMLGDVNGDGFDDVAIGIYSSAEPFYIVFGRASGFDDIYIGELDTAAKLAAKGVEAVYGPSGVQKFGRQVEAAGDVDGDGLADVLVSPPRGDAYVIFGSHLAGSAAAPDPAGVVKATESNPDIDGTSTEGEFLQGSAGDNAIGGIGSGDVAYGGAGDDSFTITASDFKRAYGGYGDDELILGGSGLELDFSAHSRATARVESIESIDLTGSGNNTLTLDEHAVYQITEQRAGGKTTLTIDGDAGDTLKLEEGISATDTSKWKANSAGTLYELGNAVLVVESAITVEVA